MSTKIFSKWYLFIVVLSMAACSTEEKNNEPKATEGTDPISVAGSLARSAVPNTTNLYLKAFLSASPTVEYIAEMPVNATGGLSDTKTSLVFPEGNPHYPLENGEISFYAYTEKAPNNKMQLKAGVGASFDYVLSNYGKRSSWPGVDVSYEGLGTPGSSSDAVELLQFRHVMTQLIVEVQVDTAETPTSVDPAPNSIAFTLPNLVAKGEYDIKASAPVSGSEASAAIASNTSGAYTVTLGENYFIPNGANLSRTKLTSLIIDDYTATADDLNGFEITPDVAGDDMWLVPGYSYKLTLTVQRLRVKSIKIQKIDWKAREMTDNTTFTPYPLSLTLGSYADNGNDAITKVVLHTSSSRVYTGGLTNGQLQFITLPTTGVVRADLYTAKGLLLSAPISTEYTTGSLALNLSVAGMLLEDPSQPADITNPYMIATPLQLLNIAKDLNASYKQANSLDMKSLSVSGADATFNGLGELKGTYNGNGFYIANVNIAGSGLFSINSGTIQSLRLYTGNIDASGQPNAGSICGVNNGLIVGCINEAQIVKAPSTVGGICGLNGAGGRILASVNTGSILNGTVVGGICGHNENATDWGVMAACISTGMLDWQATSLGAICGTSVPSTQRVVRGSFWLVGIAQRYVGGAERAVDTNGISTFDTSGLDPHALRNGLSAGDPESKRVINRLNTEMSNYPSWKDLYEYTIDRAVSGITWPAPVKK